MENNTPDVPTWTVEQLLGEIAAILVRLENGRVDDAREMAELIAGGSAKLDRARSEFKEEFQDNKRFIKMDQGNLPV